MGEQVQVSTQDAYFDAYLAQPDSAATSGIKAGIVVIQEIFGVNDDIRATADWLADKGYLALAPDLFWQQQRNVNLNAQNERDLETAFELMTNYDANAGAHDLQAAINFLRAQGCAKVGTIGFCLGGRMVYLAACRRDGEAHASYYGVGIQDMLDEAQNIMAPTLIHIAEQDAFVPPEAQQKIAAGLAQHELVDVHIYQDQAHAFARHGGAAFNRAAADLAHSRTLAMFEKALG
jgi:carboxymethylenebutenolidase